MGVRRVGLKILMKTFLSSSQAQSFILLVSVQCVRDFCMYLCMATVCMCGYGEHVCVLCRHVGGSFVCTRMCVCVVWVCVLEGGYNIHSLSLCYAVRNV